jgi:hypothetical protein
VPGLFAKAKAKAKANGAVCCNCVFTNAERSPAFRGPPLLPFAFAFAGPGPEPRARRRRASFSLSHFFSVAPVRPRSPARPADPPPCGPPRPADHLVSPSCLRASCWQTSVPLYQRTTCSAQAWVPLSTIQGFLFAAVPVREVSAKLAQLESRCV